MRRIALLLFSLLLAGCAGGMSKKECLYADWRAIGYEDGAQGRDASAIGCCDRVDDRKPVLKPILAWQRQIDDQQSGSATTFKNGDGFVSVARDDRFDLERFDRVEAFVDPPRIRIGHEHVGWEALAKRRGPGVTTFPRIEVDERRRHAGSPGAGPTSGGWRAGGSAPFTRTRFLPAAFA